MLNWNGVDDTMLRMDHLPASEGVNYRVIQVDNAAEGEDFRRRIAITTAGTQNE